MRYTMKKASIILMVVMSIIINCGCVNARELPEDTIVAFNNAIKTFDIEKLHNYLSQNVDNLQTQLDSNKEMPDAMTKQMKEWASSLEYSIVEHTENGSEATVKVQYKFTDSTPVLTETILEYFDKVFDMAVSGASDEEMESLFSDIFIEKTASVKTDKIETIVTYTLAKDANGSWKITDLPNEVVNVITSNMLNYFSQIADSLDSLTK